MLIVPFGSHLFVLPYILSYMISSILIVLITVHAFDYQTYTSLAQTFLFHSLIHTANVKLIYVGFFTWRCIFLKNRQNNITLKVNNSITLSNTQSIFRFPLSFPTCSLMNLDPIQDHLLHLVVSVKALLLQKYFFHDSDSLIVKFRKKYYTFCMSLVASLWCHLAAFSCFLETVSWLCKLQLNGDQLNIFY